MLTCCAWAIVGFQKLLYELVNEAMVTWCGTHPPIQVMNIYWLVIRCYSLAVNWIILLLTLTRFVSMGSLCMMILSLPCSLVLMEMKPSFNSIPWGLLFNLILMCQWIGKPIICLLLFLQEKNGIEIQ